MVKEKVLQRSYEILLVIESVMTHFVSEKKMGLRVDKALIQEIERVLGVDDLVLLPMKDDCRAAYISDDLDVVESFLYQNICQPTTYFSRNVIYRLDWLFKQTCIY